MALPSTKAFSINTIQSAADVTTFKSFRNPAYEKGGITISFVEGAFNPTDVISMGAGDWMRWTLFESSERTPSAVLGFTDESTVASSRVVAQALGILGDIVTRVSQPRTGILYTKEWISLGVDSATTGVPVSCAVIVGYEEVDLTELELTQAAWK